MTTHQAGAAVDPTSDPASGVDSSAWPALKAEQASSGHVKHALLHPEVPALGAPGSAIIVAVRRSDRPAAESASE
jgi:hypothetical protein